MNENKKNKLESKEIEFEEKRIVPNPKKVIITIPNSINEKLEKISKEDYIDLESMIKDYLNNKISTYDSEGIACDDCGRNIKEKEQYYSQESAFCTYEKIGGKATEDRLDSWSDKTLCMSCKHKQDEKKDITNMKIRNHNRNEIPLKIELIQTEEVEK